MARLHRPQINARAEAHDNVAQSDAPGDDGESIEQQKTCPAQLLETVDQ